MRRRTTTWSIPLLAIAAAGLVACGGGDTGQQTEMEGEAQETAEAADQMEDTAAAGTMADSAVEVSLAPKNKSGIRGTASLRHRADTLRVSLRLTGLEAGSSYPAHIHEGTCQEGGGVAAGLTSVSATDSTGTSETRIPAGKLTMEGSYFVQAHLPDGTPAACADLPSHAGGSGMDTASSAGGGGG